MCGVATVITPPLAHLYLPYFSTMTDDYNDFADSDLPAKEDRSSEDDDSRTRNAIVVLFVLVVALLLSTVGACIGFALEISNLKSETQTESSLQLVDALIQQMDVTTY